MISLIAFVEMAILIGLAWLWTRRAPESQPQYGRRMLAIAGLVLAQNLANYLFASRAFLGSEGARHGFHGLAWITQGVRALLLLWALRLWWGLVRPELDRPKLIATVVALLLMAFGQNGLNILGFFAMLIVAGRFRWQREILGWRRALALVAGLLLMTLAMIQPSMNSNGQTSVSVATPQSREWPPALASVGAHEPGATELRLSRPFDHVVEGVTSLFFAQLVIFALRMLTLPIRLSGMSLKRRFLVNYLLVSQIPGLLGTVVTIVGAYFAFGILRASQVRGDLDRSLARSSAAASALLGDTQVVRGGPESAARLDAARAWLGSDSTKASFVMREWNAAAFATAAATDTVHQNVPTPKFVYRDNADSLVAAAPAPVPMASAGRVLASSAGATSALLEFRPRQTKDGRFEGIAEAGGNMYLVAREHASTPAPGRAIDVFVPLDSTALNRLASHIGARLMLTVERGVRVANEGLSISTDTSGAGAIRVSSSRGSGHQRELFLARSLLPLGDWRAGWSSGLRGAVQLELRITRGLLFRSFADVPGWLFSNIFMLALVGGLLTLIGITQGLAVRSGRTIVQAIEDEVAELRTAAERFGAGDLAHRVPVAGRDELSALAGSFNEMAANLEQQRRELVEKERMEEELEVARQIQRRFLPQHPPNVAGLEVAGLSRPSREVGGDLFYYVVLPDGKLGIALGDVSGKSVPAALLMSNVMSALRTEAEHEQVVEKSLERINRLIIEQIEPGRFVTVFYGVVDPQSNHLQYTSAGHNPPLRLTAAGEVEWLRAGGVPLGVLADSRYPGAEAKLEMGDTLIVYSDGVTEAEGPGPGGQTQLFGEDRLVDTVRALRGQSSEAIVRGILTAVQHFAADRPQADDITLVVVRRV